MSMQYELVVVVDPKVEEKQAQVKLTTLLEKEGFRVSDIDSWGKKPFAYQIKKHSEGLYFSFQLATESAKPNTLYPKMKVDETILRYLVLRKEEGRKEKSKSEARNSKQIQNHPSQKATDGKQIQ